MQTQASQKPQQLDPALAEIVWACKSGHLNEKTLTAAINNCAESHAIAAVNHIKEYLIIGGICLLALAQMPPVQQVVSHGASATSSAVSSVITGASNQPVPSKYDAMAIAKLMQSQGYRLRTAPGAVNVVYLQNPNFLATMGQWSDRRIILVFKDANTPVIIHDAEATTKPTPETFASPPNRSGSPVIVPGQYLNSWVVGQHCGASGKCQEALVQAGPVLLIRSKDGGKTFASPRWELTGINQHHGYNVAAVKTNIAQGCLVGKSIQEHQEFMASIKRDPDYIRNRNFRIPTTILSMGELK